MNIPRSMSTQHPDNVSQPFFVDNSIIAGDDEIKEAFYAFSHLKITEQLWDCEGKEVDNFVIEKLLTKYPDFFSKKTLGKDVFITLRTPNPRIEKDKGKLLLETLESIPRNFDISREFYKNGKAPIFEVTVPMVSSAQEILMVKNYYDQHVIGKAHTKLSGMKIKDWVGDFMPKEINVIPLIEDKNSMLKADKIVREYVQKAKIKNYQRVWLARSDPALNYGNISAVLINRIAFQKLYNLQKELGIDIYPIIGCGGVPFRGNFTPNTAQRIVNVYPSVQTFTMQSAFKYDYPEDKVRKAVRLIEKTKRTHPNYVDEKKSLEIIEKVSKNYQSQIKELAPIVNKMSTHIPQRRKRKLHVGLFGYSRDGSGVKLPRAIKFCASLYSLGLPPEILGMNDLNKEDWRFLRENSGLIEDMKDAIQYFNKDCLTLLSDQLKEQIIKSLKPFEIEINEAHKKITSIIIEDFKNNNLISLSENIERAASIRRFLG
ncbi:phosphoenolpyruvate carboxylase [archaeon]|nr:phosphoenolpyruvate carboxylase [archaeon]MBT4022705.1 phosphoenolpyruvate carboxylase [archaeon]MBT4273101.1 phosphoenolpyruvate carboxylase [archaeon]MBT4461082.1 phosphoenolpyruvate carboxylase [archaeon]MBT4858751.1 phosphoenolpyruvate carboxylase [archaeon]